MEFSYHTDRKETYVFVVAAEYLNTAKKEEATASPSPPHRRIPHLFPYLPIKHATGSLLATKARQYTERKRFMKLKHIYLHVYIYIYIFIYIKEKK